MMDTIFKEIKELHTLFHNYLMMENNKKEKKTRELQKNNIFKIITYIFYCYYYKSANPKDPC